MDNYRAWFKAKTDTFKETYCTQVDNYFELVLRQIEAFTSRTGDESPQELSRMIKHMEDTNTIYKRHLDLISRRYFAGKATFSSVSSTINESNSVANPITLSDPNTGNSYQVDDFAEYSTNQQQQANISQGESSVGGQGNEMKETKLVEEKARAQQPQQQTSPGVFKRTLASPVPTGSTDAKRTRGVLVKGHTCATCGHIFVSKSQLNQHLTVHTQERPYACDQCDRAFTRKDHFRVHLLTHSGTMKGRCTWPGCTFQASKSSNVVMHIRTVHFKLPPTKKMQAQLDIIDARNPYDYYQKI